MKTKMKRILNLFTLSLFAIAFAGLRPANLSAKEDIPTILILKGEMTPFTNTLFSSFLANSKERVAFQNFKGSETITDFDAIKKINPSVIITMGEAPVPDLAKAFKKIQIVAVGYYDNISLQSLENVIPVTLDIPAKESVSILRMIFPDKKRIGVLYNPKLTKFVTSEFKAELEKNGFELAAIKVDAPEDVMVALKAFKGNIDLFYFITDATVFRSQALNTVFSFLSENKIPYVTPISAFLKENGVAAISVDPIATGRTVYRIAERIISEGKKKEDISSNQAKTSITFSISNAKKFGINSEQTTNLFQTMIDKGYKLEIVE